MLLIKNEILLIQINLFCENRYISKIVSSCFEFKFPHKKSNKDTVLFNTSSSNFKSLLKNTESSLKKSALSPKLVTELLSELRMNFKVSLGDKACSASTASYCRARSRLPVEFFERISRKLFANLTTINNQKCVEA